MSFRTIVSAACLTLSVVGSTHAQCVSYIRSQVPDFDQRRAWDLAANPPVIGLANNGSMFCVPTSWTNFMGWLANRGYTNAMGDSGNWAAASRYQLVTNRIFQMGDLMDTDGEDGTDSSDAVSGLLGYMNARNVGIPSIAFSYVADGNWAPSPSDLRSSMRAGHMVCVVFGKYVRDGTEWEREGGHCMTLVRVQAPCNNQGWIIGVRDPWTGSSDSRTSQSAFSTRTIELFSNNFNFDGDVRRQYRDVNDTDDTRYYLDKMQVLIPLQTISNVAGGNQVNLTQLTGLWPEIPQVQSFNAPGGLTIDSAVTDGGLRTCAVITRPAGTITVIPSKLWHMNPTTGEFVHIADLASLPTDSVFDRFGNLLLTVGTQIRKYDFSAETPVFTLAASTGIALDALCTNPASDTIFAFDTTRRSILVYSGGNLANPPVERSIGGLFGLTGRASIAVRPTNNSLWITTENSTFVRRLAVDIGSGNYVSVESVAVPAGVSPKSLGFTDEGDMIIGDGSVRVLREARANWVELNDHPLTGLPVSGRFTVPRSGHNHSSAQLLPTWRDLPDPVDLPGLVTLDCPGDFNANGVLEVADIFAFLSAWFAADPNADFNASGLIDVPDIFAFLSAWFAGC